MSSKLFNITANTLRPGPTLTIVRQPDGRTTAIQDFTCRKFDIGKPILRGLLVKGRALTDLYPEAGPEFSYLKLDDWTSRDEPGGITTVTANFSGVDQTSGDSSNESAITYTRNNALRDDSIFNKQGFIDLTSDVQDAIKAASDGLAYLDGSEIKRNLNDAVIASISDPDSEKWYDIIVRKGNTTYLVPTSEWTKTATNRGKLSAAIFANFGKIVKPPGAPSAPPDHTWLFTGATESIQVLGDGANSYSLTYTSGPWSTDLYDSESTDLSDTE
jgi:hypothetical protein